LNKKRRWRRNFKIKHESFKIIIQNQVLTLKKNLN